jgi:hypothetical protein
MVQQVSVKSGTFITGLFDSAVTFKKYTAEKLAFIGLGLLDLLLTVLAINLGLSEINPVMRLLIQLPALLLMVKFFIPILIAWLMPGKLLWPSIAMLFMVVVWNIKELAIFFV